MCDKVIQNTANTQNANTDVKTNMNEEGIQPTETQGMTSNNTSTTTENTQNKTRILSPMTGALSVLSFGKQSLGTICTRPFPARASGPSASNWAFFVCVELSGLLTLAMV
jgi:hypothetical protein